MATKTRKSTKGHPETIATCAPCQRTYIMCGTPGQLRRERPCEVCGRHTRAGGYAMDVDRNYDT
jgi:hypothetical protein